MSAKTLTYVGLAPAVCSTKCGRPLYVTRELWNARAECWTGELACDAGHHVTDSRRIHETRPHAYRRGAQQSLF